MKTPIFWEAYCQDAFNVKQHLQGFLNLDPETLASRLQTSQQELAELGRRDFNWEQAEAFYRDQVGVAYLFDLAAWHLSSQDYIGDTLRLIADHTQGIVLDFGGGIGTHTLAAAMLPDVEQVIFWDLNTTHQDLMVYRAQQLGLEHKIQCAQTFPPEIKVDTIICFDVLEHLSDPAQQLLEFKSILSKEGTLIVNWYFFKGFAGEFPFHLDNPIQIERFFQVLQTQFREIFHPYLITARCYRSDS